MNRTSKYTARLLAVLALAAVAIAVIVIASSFKGESNDTTAKGGGKGQTAKQHQEAEAPQRTTAKAYTVQSGDTLTAIAHKTGVTVAELQALNPEIDPQILIAGEVLKLR
jgi:LysM repeat protein